MRHLHALMCVTCMHLYAPPARTYVRPLHGLCASPAHTYVHHLYAGAYHSPKRELVYVELQLQVAAHSLM